MASEISSISHLGVDVAPHTPIELTPGSKESSISSALSIKCEFGLTFLHSRITFCHLNFFYH